MDSRPGRCRAGNGMNPSSAEWTSIAAPALSGYGTFGFAGTVEFRSWIAIGLSAARSGLPHPCQHGRLRWTKPCQAWQYLYLWHWPVLLLAPPLLGHSVALGERLAAATSRRPCRGWRVVGGSVTLQPDQDSFGLWLGQTGRVHGCDAGCPRLRRRGSGH